LQTKSKHTSYVLKRVSENPACYEMTWRTMVDPERPQWLYSKVRA